MINVYASKDKEINLPNRIKTNKQRLLVKANNPQNLSNKVLQVQQVRQRNWSLFSRQSTIVSEQKSLDELVTTQECYRTLSA